MIRIQQKGNNALSISGATIPVNQCIFNNTLTELYFLVNHDNQIVEYDNSTDRVFIIADNGFSKELTRAGNYFKLTLGATDFFSFNHLPGVRTSYAVRIAYERTTAGVSTTDISDTFNLSILRSYSWAPNMIGGCLHWFDNFDLTETVGTSVNSYEDSSGFGSDMTGGTVKPTIGNFTNGMKGLLFTSTADENMVSAYSQFGTPITVVGVCQLEVVDGTERSIMKFGGANGMEIVFDSTSFKSQSNTSEETETVPLVKDTFIFTATYDETNLTMKINNGSEQTSAVANSVTNGVLTLNHGGSAGTKGNFVLGDFAVFNSVLSSGNQLKLIRAFAGKYNVAL